MCCLNKLAKTVSEKDAKGIRKQMAAPDLVFITRENEEILKKRIKLPEPPSMTVEEMKEKLAETYAEPQEG